MNADAEQSLVVFLYNVNFSTFSILLLPVDLLAENTISTDA